jgi:hypothetical protein
MKTYGVVEVYLHMLDYLGTCWRRVVIFTYPLLYPREKLYRGWLSPVSSGHC